VAVGVSGGRDDAGPAGVLEAFGRADVDPAGLREAELEALGAWQPCATRATMSSSIAAANPRARDGLTGHDPT
jgi:hypothetical protein